MLAHWPLGKGLAAASASTSLTRHGRGRPRSNKQHPSTSSKGLSNLHRRGEERGVDGIPFSVKAIDMLELVGQVRGPAEDKLPAFVISCFRHPEIDLQSMYFIPLSHHPSPKTQRCPL